MLIIAPGGATLASIRACFSNLLRQSRSIASNRHVSRNQGFLLDIHHNCKTSRHYLVDKPYQDGTNKQAFPEHHIRLLLFFLCSVQKTHPLLSQQPPATFFEDTHKISDQESWILTACTSRPRPRLTTAISRPRAPSSERQVGHRSKVARVQSMRSRSPSPLRTWLPFSVPRRFSRRWQPRRGRRTSTKHACLNQGRHRLGARTPTEPLRPERGRP